MLRWWLIDYCADAGVPIPFSKWYFQEPYVERPNMAANTPYWKARTKFMKLNILNTSQSNISRKQYSGHSNFIKMACQTEQRLNAVTSLIIAKMPLVTYLKPRSSSWWQTDKLLLRIKLALIYKTASHRLCCSKRNHYCQASSIHWHTTYL